MAAAHEPPAKRLQMQPQATFNFTFAASEVKCLYEKNSCSADPTKGDTFYKIKSKNPASSKFLCQFHKKKIF
ncbi:MAG: hypothetical protein EBS29_08265 [Chloroflexia bacterium]|nr:hypothetical protein [Chloroflexia bacterium]